MTIYAIKNYQQIYNAMEGYLVGVGSGFTNFNIGSRIRTLLEAVSLVSGETHYVFYEGLREAIPVSLYEGFNFTKKTGNKAGGFVELGLTDVVTSDTLYPSAIKITANGHDYETTNPFAIKNGEKKNGITIPFIVTAISKQGVWDAIANNPIIPLASPANRGWYYEITNADDNNPENNTEIDGINNWKIGDWIISDGAKWYKGDSKIDVPILALAIGESSNLSPGDIDTQNGFGAFQDDYNLDYAKNNTAISGGTDSETDEERKARFFAFVNGLTKTNVPGILSAALGVEGVNSAYLLENYPSNGWITLYLDDGTGTYNPTLFARARKIILGDHTDMLNFPGYRAAGIKLQILPPNLLLIGMTAVLDIYDATIYSPDAIVDEAKTKIEQYINSQELGLDIILTEITTAAQNAHKDIIDIRISQMTVNSVPVVIGNIPVAFNAIAKTGILNISYNLIPRP